MKRLKIAFSRGNKRNEVMKYLHFVKVFKCS